MAITTGITARDPIVTRKTAGISHQLNKAYGNSPVGI